MAHITDVAAAPTCCCDVCNKLFSSRNSLFKHLKSQHPKTLSVNADEVGTGTTYDTMANKGIITIVLEDASWYRVISKPQYIATMGGKGETLVNSDSMLIDGAITFKKAVPCHRLDKVTGGLVVCRFQPNISCLRSYLFLPTHPHSKNKFAERLIKASFNDHKVRKRYRAIVAGKLEPLEGIVDTPLDDKPSITKFKVVEYTRSKEYQWITTVDLFPISGRRHQLRRHLAQIGHHIIGDQRYSPAALWPSSNTVYADTLFLWSVEVEFPDPIDMFNYIGEENLTSDTLTGIEKQSIIDKSYEHSKKITVMIDEPVYYESFRRSQEGAL